MGDERPPHDPLVVRERALDRGADVTASIFLVQLPVACRRPPPNEVVRVGQRSGERAGGAIALSGLGERIDDSELGVGHPVGRRGGPDLVQSGEQVVARVGDGLRAGESRADRFPGGCANHGVRRHELSRQERRDRTVTLGDDGDRRDLDARLGVVEQSLGGGGRFRLRPSGQEPAGRNAHHRVGVDEQAGHEVGQHRRIDRCQCGERRLLQPTARQPRQELDQRSCGGLAADLADRLDGRARHVLILVGQRALQIRLDGDAGVAESAHRVDAHARVLVVRQRSDARQLRAARLRGRQPPSDLHADLSAGVGHAIRQRGAGSTHAGFGERSHGRSGRSRRDRRRGEPGQRVGRCGAHLGVRRSQVLDQRIEEGLRLGELPGGERRGGSHGVFRIVEHRPHRIRAGSIPKAPQRIGRRGAHGGRRISGERLERVLRRDVGDQPHRERSGGTRRGRCVAGRFLEARNGRWIPDLSQRQERLRSHRRVGIGEERLKVVIHDPAIGRSQDAGELADASVVGKPSGGCR